MNYEPQDIQMHFLNELGVLPINYKPRHKTITCYLLEPWNSAGDSEIFLAKVGYLLVHGIRRDLNPILVSTKTG